RKLQNPLQELENKLQTLISKKSTFTNILTNLQSQGQQTETQIKELFKKLQQSLKDEEKDRLTALRNEQRRKKENITEKITEVEKSKTSLSKIIKTIKDDLGCDDILVLHNFINIQERVNITVQDPQLDSGCEIDVAKHMGNLRYSVWESIKKSCPY
ncbi:tripartite motif-containing protein 35-like isoform X1, partial [Clarias magur]